MKYTVTAFFILLSTLNSVAQEKIVKRQYNQKISFIRIDSSYKSQSTVIEYDDFIAILELPAIEKSSDREEGLNKETLQGQKFLAYLTAQYEKPVKYIFCSHCHYHTLSGILPFLQAGSKIVTTTKNWQTSIKNGILNPEHVEQFSQNIITVDHDTTFLKKTEYPIELVYLDSSNVYFTPTDDYLMFYLKKNKILHASCLAWIKDIDYEKLGTYTYNSRLDGLFRAIEDKNLKPESIIRLEHNTLNNPIDVNYIYSVKEIKKIMANAISADEMIEYYINIDEKILTNSQDSLLSIVIAQQLHPNLIRIAALENLNDKKYSKALSLAVFLNLYFPGSPKYMDLLGECYYASGDLEKAIYYDNHLGKFSDKYGMKKWKNRK